MAQQETEREVQVLAVFRQLLQAPALGPEENFFEAGGSSLLAARLATRLRSTGVLDVPTSAIFAAPTARALTQYSANTAVPAGAASSDSSAPSDRAAPDPASLRGARQRAAFARLRPAPVSTEDLR